MNAAAAATAEFFCDGAAGHSSDRHDSRYCSQHVRVCGAKLALVWWFVSKCVVFVVLFQLRSGTGATTTGERQREREYVISNPGRKGQ